MLTYHRTSILTSQAQTVVNTVNTVGVMGKGLASEYKKRYPEMFKAYRELCKNEQLGIGNLWLWKATDQWVLNFPTKKHWRQPSKLSYVEAGLEKFVSQYERRGISEIAFPRLGCGNGGLDWEDVGPLMERYLGPLPISVFIHDFEVDIGCPEHRIVPETTSYQRSFDAFIKNIAQVLYSERGYFYTVTNQSPFRAIFDDDNNLLITRNGSRRIVPNEEIYELWTLLLRGPLTRQKLSGAAREQAYYIFPILSHLPYIRPIQIARRDDTVAMAVEMLDQTVSIGEVPDNGRPKQGELEWR